MAICRPEAIDAAPERAGAERRMAAGRLSCLARNGRSPGEESRAAAVAAQAIEAQPSSGQISQGEAVGRAPNSILGRSRGQPEGSCARGPAHQAKRRRSWRRKRTASSQPNRSRAARLACLLSSASEERPPGSGHGGLRSPIASRRAFTAPISPTCSMIGDAKSVSDPGRAAARQQASKRPRCPARPAA